MLTSINTTLPAAMPCLPERSLPPHPSPARPGSGRWLLAFAGGAAGTLALLAALSGLAWRSPTPPPARPLSAELRPPPAAPVAMAQPSASPAPPLRPSRTPSPQPVRAAAPVILAPSAAEAAALPTQQPTASPEIQETPNAAGSSTSNGNTDTAPPATVAAATRSGATATAATAEATATPLNALCPRQPRPSFPRDALREGIHAGRVVLRLMLDDEGRVIASDVLEAAPRGYFEAASQAAVLRWQCLPPAQSGQRSLRAPIHFEAN